MGWVALPGSGVPYFLDGKQAPPTGARPIPPPGADIPEPPAKSARKAEWVAHAVALGVPRALAETQTKAQLVEAVEEGVAAFQGGAPVGAEAPGVELAADAEQVRSSPTGEVPAGGEDLDSGGDVIGHDEEG